ncbi:MAG: hypothetical protein ACREIA_20545 [Opitutaceae bacterium]
MTARHLTAPAAETSPEKPRPKNRLFDHILNRPLSRLAAPSDATGDAYFVRLDEIDQRLREAEAALQAIRSEQDALTTAEEVAPDAAERFKALAAEQPFWDRVAANARLQREKHVALYAIEANNLCHRMVAARDACLQALRELVSARLRPFFIHDGMGLAGRSNAEKLLAQVVDQALHVESEIARTLGFLRLGDGSIGPNDFRLLQPVYQERIAKSERRLAQIREMASGKRPFVAEIDDDLLENRPASRRYEPGFIDPARARLRAIEAELNEAIHDVFRSIRSKHDLREFDERGVERPMAGIEALFRRDPLKHLKGLLAEHPGQKERVRLIIEQSGHLIDDELRRILS